MTSLTSISHTAKRAHGITTQTTEYFDTLGVLQKKETNVFNADHVLTLQCIEDKTNDTITELKPINGRHGIKAIKTVYDNKNRPLSQGTADQDGQYHGVISFFKPHKTRYEEYVHGVRVADLTHPIRNFLLKWGTIAVLASACATVAYKCLDRQPVHEVLRVRE